MLFLPRMKKMPPMIAVVWIVLSLIWGTTWIAIKIGLEDLPPITFAAIRFLLASAILLVVLRTQNIPLPQGRQWRLIALTGTLQFAVNYSLVFWGEQHISSGLTAVLQATLSVFGLVLAWIHLPHERITVVKMTAVGLGVAGVAVVFSDQLRVQSVLAFWASVGIVFSGYAAAQASILVKAKGGGMNPATMLFGQMLCGLPPLVVLAFIVEGNPLAIHWTWRAVACVLYLAVLGTIAAFWLYYWMLNRVESTIAMMLSVVTPIIAVLVGWIILDERLPPQTALGGALIIAGIALIALRRRTPGV
jgi:drug/metabolite transporter (DMT)-like permease